MSNNNKPLIVPLPNGPLYLINDREPKVVENLVNSKDEKLSNIQGIALRRPGCRPMACFFHNISSTNELSDQTANDWTVHEAGPFIDGKFALVWS